MCNSTWSREKPTPDRTRYDPGDFPGGLPMQGMPGAGNDAHVPPKQGALDALPVTAGKKSIIAAANQQDGQATPAERIQADQGDIGPGNRMSRQQAQPRVRPATQQSPGHRVRHPIVRNPHEKVLHFGDGFGKEGVLQVTQQAPGKTETRSQGNDSRRRESCPVSVQSETQRKGAANGMTEQKERLSAANHHEESCQNTRNGLHGPELRPGRHGGSAEAGKVDNHKANVRFQHGNQAAKGVAAIQKSMQTDDDRP